MRFRTNFQYLVKFLVESEESNDILSCSVERLPQIKHLNVAYYLGCVMCFVSKMTVSRLKSAIYEPHLMKNWEGYFLNSYSPIKWLVCVINLLRARISLLRVCTAQAMWLPFWLYIDIYINIITFILAFSNQIESFHKLHIKPNKLDSPMEK